MILMVKEERRLIFLFIIQFPSTLTYGYGKHNWSDNEQNNLKYELVLPLLHHSSILEYL